LCERLYLNQSKRRQLHVSRFDNSYRRMLELRPRVRAAGGCYVLRYSQIKTIQRDMWTEVPIGAVLESIYYRYLYFQEDGRVLYALSSAPPHEMFRRLLRVVLHRSGDPAAVWGTFQVQKTTCTVVARQDWHVVRFDLTIVPSSIHGRFAALTMDRHLSSPTGRFDDWSDDRVEYTVPSEHFRFVKDRRL
jgi:F-box protein 9